MKLAKLLPKESRGFALSNVLSGLASSPFERLNSVACEIWEVGSWAGLNLRGCLAVFIILWLNAAPL